MDVTSTFYDVFGDNPPIIGMVHISGAKTGFDQLNRALEEIKIYEDNGIDAIIVENYHGSISDVESVLQIICECGTKLKVGINILPNEYITAFRMAEQYDADFIQLDHVAGKYRQGELISMYEGFRKKHPTIAVLGGVWPKYYEPVYGSDCEKDLKIGMERSDAIVVTGEGTGKETPIEKIQKFREIMGPDFPLIVGAGVTPDNAYEQLEYADGVIVGSALKQDNNTHNMVDLGRVIEFVKASKIPINATYVRNVIDHNLDYLKEKQQNPEGYFSHYDIPAGKIPPTEIDIACKRLVEKGILDIMQNPNHLESSWYIKKN